MNQSIDKLANLLLARKAIHSLPANTSLTLRELNALVMECHGAANTASAESTTSSAAASKQFFLGIRSSHDNTDNGEVFYHNHNRHPHQAPLSITNHTNQQLSPSSFVAAAMDATSTGARFQIAIRQLSTMSMSSSSPKQ
jgi:hypothetical protein